MSHLLRVGRKVGRTIYEQHGAGPDDGDPLVGTMDTRDLAAEVVEAVNRQRNASAQEEEVEVLLAMARDWTNPVVVRDAPERVPHVIEQLIAAIERLR